MLHTYTYNVLYVYIRMYYTIYDFHIPSLQNYHQPRQAIVDTAVWVQNIDAKMLKNEQSLRTGEKSLEEDENYGKM